MKTFLIFTATVLFGIFAARSQTTNVGASPTAVATANPSPPPSAGAKKSAAELQKLVEPIALHPDPLIALILPASAYPLEVVQAARFVKDTNNIPKLDDQPWDENVRGIAKFPEVIAKMDADLPWTINLGQAFIDQPKELMDAIQDLRSKAQKAGNLKTSPQQIVSVTNIVVLQTNVTEVVNVTKEVIEIVPANPSVIYVPSYPPAVYYPWYPYYAYAAPVVGFGVGLAWGMAWGAAWGHCNWGGGSVDIDIDSNRNVNRDRNRNTDRAQNRDRASNTGRGGSGSGRQQWKADQNRMQKSGAGQSNRAARGWGGSTGARPSTGNVGSRPSTGNVGARPSTGNVGSRPSTGNASSRASASTRPSTSQSRGSSYSNRSSSSGSSAFNRSGGGSSTRSSSSRGSSSRGGGGFSGGGGRGGGGGGGRR